MKTIVLGDTHGRTIWKDIVKAEKPDQVIFIGDYFDTHDDISPEEQIKNFQDIITWKEERLASGYLTDILLIGNHDYHYFPEVRESYSGYQARHRAEIQHLLSSAYNLGYLKIAHFEHDTLFSHAGVSKTFLVNNDIDLKADLDSQLNLLFKENIHQFAFTPGEFYNPYGDERCQTPIWIRPASLVPDGIGITQVVGHTTQPKLRNVNMSDKGPFVFIDTLGTSGEYLCIENNVAINKILSNVTEQSER